MACGRFRSALTCLMVGAYNECVVEGHSAVMVVLVVAGGVFDYGVVKSMTCACECLSI